MPGKYKNRLGVVYSTNRDYPYLHEHRAEPESLPPQQQKLTVRIERKDRGGKTVTLVENFIGKTSDLESLGRHLKAKCGTGGSVKDGVILIQGDFRKKIAEILSAQEFKVSIG